MQRVAEDTVDGKGRQRATEDCGTLKKAAAPATEG